MNIDLNDKLINKLNRQLRRNNKGRWIGTSTEWKELIEATLTDEIPIDSDISNLTPKIEFY